MSRKRRLGLLDGTYIPIALRCNGHRQGEVVRGERLVNGRWYCRQCYSFLFGAAA